MVMCVVSQSMKKKKRWRKEKKNNKCKPNESNEGKKYFPTMRRGKELDQSKWQDDGIVITWLHGKWQKAESKVNLWSLIHNAQLIKFSLEWILCAPSVSLPLLFHSVHFSSAFKFSYSKQHIHICVWNKNKNKINAKKTANKPETGRIKCTGPLCILCPCSKSVLNVQMVCVNRELWTCPCVQSHILG